ncbi:hypothetical protein ADA01nite_01110 [Aneurinibacillus danicus]|uniref:Uncharacterized protein n=1 Tax=Aneurinibacillus danicus TaxID=267746 RepID=A0A511V3J2_9BACL|nr:hypothetical protein ADA01nite_01110 [Aneurinibacillus danicus]
MVVLLVAFALAAMFTKSGNSPSDVQTAQQASSSHEKDPASVSSESDREGVVRIPLDKTLDEAKAEGLYSESNSGSASVDRTHRNSEKTSNQENTSSSDGQTGQSTESATVEQAAAAGQGLDANVISQLRSHGIREGDLAKIDRMVAEGVDPKEIAQSLRKNGNPNLAAVMDQVSRKPKKEDKPKKEEKAKKQEKEQKANGDDDQQQDNTENDDD